MQSHPTHPPPPPSDGHDYTSISNGREKVKKKTKTFSEWYAFIGADHCTSWRCTPLRNRTRKCCVFHHKVIAINEWHLGIDKEPTCSMMYSTVYVHWFVSNSSLYTGWPRKNKTGYFPQCVDAITDISVWGNFSWEKWYPNQQFWFSSCFLGHSLWGNVEAQNCPFSA